MGINGIAANYYQAGYTNNQATKAEAGKSFVEIASQKVTGGQRNGAGKNLCCIRRDWSKCT